MRNALAAFLTAALFVLPGTASAFEAKTLAAPKGEEVWFSEDHSNPMIVMVASFPAGSAYDPPGKSGLSAFAGSLMDEGAGKLDSKGFQAALADRAIQLSITPDRDATVVTLITLSANAKEAFRLLGLALTSARFDADAVARVRAQMIQSLRQQDEDPASVAATGFDRAFFRSQPYGHPIGGDEAGLAAITRDDARAFARAHWVRGGLKVSVAGDVNSATLCDLLRSAFGALPASAPPEPPLAGKLGAPGVHIIAMPVPQPTVIFGLPGPLRADRDFLTAYVANYIVGGGGFSSRLMNEVREKRGLTYGISTDLASYADAGVLEGAVATRRDAVGQTIAVVRATLREFSANGPTAAELADAKTYLTGSFPLAFSSDAAIASQLAMFQREGLPIDYMARRNGLIDAVTLDDVRRVAKRLFDPARLTVVVAGTPMGEKGK